MRFACALFLFYCLLLLSVRAEESARATLPDNANPSKEQDRHASMKQGLDFLFKLGLPEQETVRPVFLTERFRFTPNDSPLEPQVREQSLCLLLCATSDTDYTVLMPRAAYPITLKRKHEISFTDGSLVVSRTTEDIDFSNLPAVLESKEQRAQADGYFRWFSIIEIAYLYRQGGYAPLVDGWLAHLKALSREERKQKIESAYKRTAYAQYRQAMVPPADTPFSGETYFQSVRKAIRALHKTYPDVFELEDVLHVPEGSVDALQSFDEDPEADPALRPKLVALLDALDSGEDNLLSLLGLMHATHQTHPDLWRTYHDDDAIPPESPLYALFKDNANSLQLLHYLMKDYRAIPWFYTHQETLRGLGNRSWHGSRIPNAFFRDERVGFGLSGNRFDDCIRRADAARYLSFLLVPNFDLDNPEALGEPLTAYIKRLEESEEPQAFLKAHLREGRLLQIRTALSVLGDEAPTVLEALGTWLKEQRVWTRRAITLLRELHEHHPEEAMKIARGLQANWDAIEAAHASENQSANMESGSPKQQSGHKQIEWLLISFGDPTLVAEEEAYQREGGMPYPVGAQPITGKEHIKEIRRLREAAQYLPPESIARLLQAPLRPDAKMQLINYRFFRNVTAMTEIERTALYSLLDDTRLPYNYIWSYATPQDFAAAALFMDAHLYDSEYRYLKEQVLLAPDRRAWCVEWAKAVAAGEAPPARPFTENSNAQILQAGTIALDQAADWYRSLDEANQGAVRQYWLREWSQNLLRRKRLRAILKKQHPNENLLTASSLAAIQKGATQGEIDPVLAEQILKIKEKSIGTTQLMKLVEAAYQAKPGFVLHIAKRADARGVEVRVDPLLDEAFIPIRYTPGKEKLFLVILNVEGERAHAIFQRTKKSIQTYDLMNSNSRMQRLLNGGVDLSSSAFYAMTVYSRPDADKEKPAEPDAAQPEEKEDAE